jgi:hypothetical protein
MFQTIHDVALMLDRERGTRSEPNQGRHRQSIGQSSGSPEAKTRGYDAGKKGRAIGVVTAKGEKIIASAVVSNLHPKLTFEKLLDPALLPADFRARIDGYRSGSGSFRMNVGLSELPSFSALPGREAAEHHGAGIVIAPSLAYMERLHRRPAVRLVN